MIKPLTPQQLFDSRDVVIPEREQRSEFVRAYLGQTFDEDFVATWKYRESIQTMLQQVTHDADFNLATTVQNAYRRALSREPTPADLRVCQGHSPEAVLAALLQTNEFVFNH